MRKVILLSLALAACNACGGDVDTLNVRKPQVYDASTDQQAVVEVDAGGVVEQDSSVAEQYDPCGFNSTWEVVYVEVLNECGEPLVKQLFFPVITDNIYRVCGDAALGYSLMQDINLHVCTVTRYEHCEYADAITHDTKYEFSLEANGTLVGKRTESWVDSDPCNAEFTFIATPHK